MTRRTLLAMPAVAMKDSRLPVVSLRVRPFHCFARCTVRVEVAIPKHRDNRSLLIQWDSDDGMGGASSVTLDGDRAPVMHTRDLRELTPGVYAILAVVSGPMRPRGSAQQQVTVL